MSNWEYVGEGGLPDIRNRTLKRGGRVTLDADGVASVVFDPPIIMGRKPYVVLTPHVQTNSSGLIAANVVTGSYTQDAEGRYTGCSIAAARITKSLPTGLTALNIAVTLNGQKLTDKNDVTGEVVDWLAF